MNTTKPTLKPCPFCGGNDIYRSIGGAFDPSFWDATVHCASCDVTYIKTTGIDPDCLIGAITAQWNTRPDPTEAQIRAGGELFKELRSQFDRDPQQAAKLIYKAMQASGEVGS